jgi:hypothetical protein
VGCQGSSLESHEASLNDEWDSDTSEDEVTPKAADTSCGHAGPSASPPSDDGASGAGSGSSPSTDVLLDGTGACHSASESEPGASKRSVADTLIMASDNKNGKLEKHSLKTHKRLKSEGRTCSPNPAAGAVNALGMAGTYLNHAALSAAVHQLQQQAQGGHMPAHCTTHPAIALAHLASMPQDSLQSLLKTSLWGALSAAPLASDVALRPGCALLSGVSKTARNSMIGLHSQDQGGCTQTLSAGVYQAEAQKGASFPWSTAAMHLQSTLRVEHDLGHAHPAQAGDVARNMKASLGSEHSIAVQVAEKRDHEQARSEQQLFCAVKKAKRGWRKCANCKQQHHWNSKCQPPR